MFNKLIKNIFKIQEKFLEYRLSKTIGVKNLSKRKTHFKNGCCLDLSSLANEEKEIFEKKMLNILEVNEFEPEKILEYISRTTKVYREKDIDKALNLIKENEGFLLPQTGLKALFLNIIINRKIGLKTDPMFVLSQGEINKFFFIYQVYNWFAYQNNILGIDAESQNLLNKYLYSNNDTKELQLSEIYKLKDAIVQDKASIEFVLKIARNYDGSKEALNKIKEQKGANI